MYMPSSIANIVKCWTCRAHEREDTCKQMLLLWRRRENLDDREYDGEVM